MKGIVLASHGLLAKGLLESSKMFMGEQEQLKACCIGSNTSPEGFTEELKKAIAETDKGDGVIVLCDIPFGTPFNCLSRIIDADTEVITGMNLAMLLQVMAVREAGGLESDEILNAGIKSISTMKLLFSQEEDDQLF